MTGEEVHTGEVDIKPNNLIKELLNRHIYEYQNTRYVGDSMSWNGIVTFRPYVLCIYLYRTRFFLE